LQAIPLDLTPFAKHFKSEPVNLSVSLTYTAAAQARWNLRCYCLVQREVKWSTKDRWVWKDIA